MFFTHDHYSQPNDGFRAKVAGLQDAAATTLRELYDRLGIPALDVPPGLETDQRVEWITRRVADSGLALSG